MSTHFKKKSARSKQEIPTSSMPDVIFILLIFFMVSTVMREQEIMVRTQLPQAEALTKIEQKRLVSYIYIGPEKLGNQQVTDEAVVQIDDALIEDMSTVRTIMYNKRVAEPRMIVSLKVDETTQMDLVTDVQQELREANALRINYSTRSAPESRL